jgi:flavin-dependent dehydrogenase
LQNLLINKNPGDSFTIGPTAIRAVQQWPDMAEENERIADSPWISWHKINGERISGPEPLRFNPTVNSSGQDEAPQRVYRHSRPAFHEMLSNQAERIGIFVEYGKRVTGYYEVDDKAGVTLEGGEKIESDMVIAADGIGSKSSMVTMGRELRARSSGWAMYRAAFPVELAMVDPMVRERFQLLEDGTSVMELWMG